MSMATRAWSWRRVHSADQRTSATWLARPATTRTGTPCHRGIGAMPPQWCSAHSAAAVNGIVTILPTAAGSPSHGRRCISTLLGEYRRSAPEARSGSWSRLVANPDRVESLAEVVHEVG